MSLTLYRQSFDAAAGQKELELMCLYEIGKLSFCSWNLKAPYSSKVDIFYPRKI